MLATLDYVEKGVEFRGKENIAVFFYWTTNFLTLRAEIYISSSEYGERALTSRVWW